MKLTLGQLYWYQPDNQNNPHPHVVVEINEDSVTLCSVTTNMKKLSMPGIVVLDAGEGNLEKQSIVEIYKMVTMKPDVLGDYIGTLSEKRLHEILAGKKCIEKSFQKE